MFGKLIQNDWPNPPVFYRAILITSCPDNTSLLLGHSKLPGFYISKIDSLGKSLWNRYFRINNVGTITLSSVVVLPDSGFVCIGAFRNSGYGGVYLQKVDKNGNPIFLKTYKLSNFQYYEPLKAVYHPLGFIFVAGISIHNSNCEAINILKFNSSCQLINQITLDPNNHDYISLSDLIIDKNQDLVFIGDYSNKNKAFIFNIDPQLSINFSRSYSPLNSQNYQDINFNSLKQLKNGDYIIGGRVTFNNGKVVGFGTFLKLDSIGKLLSFRLYDIDSTYLGINIDHISVTLTDQVIIATGGNNYPSGPSFLTIIKSNNDGDTLETHSYRGSNVYDFILAQDGNPVFVIYPQSSYSSIILKTDINGYYTCNELKKVIHINPGIELISNNFPLITFNDSVSSIPSTYFDSIINFSESDYCLFKSVNVNPYNRSQGFNIYPNPAKDFIQIKIDDTYTKDEFSGSIYNIVGKKMTEIRFRDQITLPIASYVQGIYLVVLQSQEGQVYTSKFIKH